MNEWERVNAMSVWLNDVEKRELEVLIMARNAYTEASGKSPEA